MNIVNYDATDGDRIEFKLTPTSESTIEATVIDTFPAGVRIRYAGFYGVVRGYFSYDMLIERNARYINPTPAATPAHVRRSMPGVKS